MRKNFLLVIFILSSSVSFSQLKLGFKMSPTISTNRIDGKSDSVSFSTDGAGLRFVAGPIVDFPITQNYHFSTGILFVSKKAAFNATSQSNAVNEQYGVQYLQIPLSLKLFTNEVALDKKIYLQIGTTMDFNVNEKAKKDSYYLIEDFKLFDSSLLIGFGLEYKMGLNTIVFGGFSYSRGLINTISDQAISRPEIILKNDYIALDLGVKF